MDETVLTCRCGACRMVLRGPPIMAAECMCASCAAAAARLEALPGAEPVRSALGGTAYVLQRKDRFGMQAGADRLAAFRLTPSSGTRRVVATCCNTPMFLEFLAGHWVSVYADRWPAAARPAMQMRTVAGDRVGGPPLPDDIPNLKGHDARFMLRLLSAWVAMGFRTPRLGFVTEEVPDG